MYIQFFKFMLDKMGSLNQSTIFHKLHHKKKSSSILVDLFYRPTPNFTKLMNISLNDNGF